MKLKAIEAEKLLQRPPLTAIKDRLELYAKEIEEDVEAIVIIEYPSNAAGTFGKMLTRAELLGTLVQVTHNICTKTDKQLNPEAA